VPTTAPFSGFKLIPDPAPRPDRFEPVGRTCRTGHLPCAQQHDEARTRTSRRLPARIGGPNKFGIPPAYCRRHEPLLDEYRKTVRSARDDAHICSETDTPFKDVVDLGIASARSRGLDAADAEAGRPDHLGMIFAETNGNQNVVMALHPKYKR